MIIKCFYVAMENNNKIIQHISQIDLLLENGNH